MEAGTATALELPAERGNPLLDRDGTSRYRGHERRREIGASRVEPWNTFFVSHP